MLGRTRPPDEATRGGAFESTSTEVRRGANAVRETIEARGYNERLDSYVSVFDGDEVDACLLLLARYGYVEPTSPRMRATCARVQERLGKNGLFYRYLMANDGLPPGEGVFGVASFWAVDCRCRQGAVDEAAAAFEHLCALANDVGLFAEELDPETGAPLGNFPQAFTHIGLIDAALTLEEFTGQGVRRSSRPRAPELGTST